MIPRQLTILIFLSGCTSPTPLKPLPKNTQYLNHEGIASVQSPLSTNFPSSKSDASVSKLSERRDELKTKLSDLNLRKSGIIEAMNSNAMLLDNDESIMIDRFLRGDITAEQVLEADLIEDLTLEMLEEIRARVPPSIPRETFEKDIRILNHRIKTTQSELDATEKLKHIMTKDYSEDQENPPATTAP